MSMIMLTMRQKTFCVYICKNPDEFTLIWSVLHVEISCALEQLSTKISWLAL